LHAALNFPSSASDCLRAQAARIVALYSDPEGDYKHVTDVGLGAWIGQYDSVGQYDEMRTKILSEGDYRTALKKARDLFTPDSGRDQIWKHQ
jgi:hypothetical protein